MIPKILHFCFGMTRDFGGKPWGLSNFVSVKSAIQMIHPDKVYFYYEYEPCGPWWEMTKPLVTLVKVDAPRAIMGNSIDHPAHRADVVRLEKLIEMGGIYLDTDVIVLRPFDNLLHHSVVMGQEGYNPVQGLANAIILAEPGAPFLLRWYAEYKSFRGNAAGHWGEHSVQLPWKLSRMFPGEITVLPCNAFYYPMWYFGDIELLYHSTKNIDFSNSYTVHLWENLSWRYLHDLTVNEVTSVDTNFHKLIRPYLINLPDSVLSVQVPGWVKRVPQRGEYIRAFLSKYYSFLKHPLRIYFALKTSSFLARPKPCPAAISSRN